MKQLIIKLIILIIALPICVHAQFSSTDRQPFSEPKYPISHSLSGSSKSNDFFNGGMKKGPGGPGDGLPNGDEGEGCWVGQGTCTVEEAHWFLLALAIGYGIIRRRKMNTD